MVKEVNEVKNEGTISINFIYEPTLIEVGIWENDGVEFKEVNNDQIALPNNKGEFIYVIHARWDEGDGIYTFAIKTN
ncbi:hypothetical protein [Cytobacillus sp. IB215665]|uniref:hypothetical protein n=1 Tax=Cytobacillus sp. IB215665 TaxID=3097357 RepID=UPI002A141A24|nr:hypothetical protein [Cytobacillus sp. IB215665]MDX8363923.1 hypothetical protein [Cytobacillus sp. IB215665]